MIYFYSMEHRGGLMESLKTIKEISITDFNRLTINKKLYKFYSKDIRIDGFRFILVKHSFDLPLWLIASTLDYQTLLSLKF